MKFNVSCAEFYQEVSDEVLLESTGIFRHLMTNFSDQLSRVQRADTRAIEEETLRVRSECARVAEGRPMSRKGDRA